MGKQSGDRVDRAMRMLDEKLSTKPAEPASKVQGDKAPRQRLQAPKGPNAKHWQSLVHSCESMSGVACRCAGPEAGRSDTPELAASEPPPPCKQSQEAWRALVFAAIQCGCAECLHLLEHAEPAYENWLTDHPR